MRRQVGLPDAGCPSGEATGPGGQSGEINFQANFYWSGTEFAPNTNNAWNFNFNNGNQNANNKDFNTFAWALHSGGVAPPAAGAGTLDDAAGLAASSAGLSIRSFE